LLRIRLVKTGSKNKKTYRIAVADHHQAVKKKNIEILGYYLPTQDPKTLEYDEERVKYWISKGAKPTDTMATLFKSKGMADMDQYIEPRDKKRMKKADMKKKEKEEGKGEKKAPEGGKEETPKEEAPKEEAKEAPKEEPKKEEAKSEEAPKDAPKEDAPEEEASKEDPKKEEPKPEEGADK